MKLKKRYSFIVPAYNCVNTLEKCVESIRSISEFCDETLEIVLADDGSVDGTSELCESLGDIVIHQKNSGVSSARNKGIRCASGDFVIFIDSDDTVDSMEFAKLLNKMKTMDNIDVVAYGMSFDYYRDGKCYRNDKKTPKFEGKINQNECLKQLLPLYETNMLSSSCNKIIRRDILIENDIFFRNDMFLYEDLEFSLRLFSLSKNFFFEKSLLYHYVQNEMQGKSGGRIEKIDRITEVVDKLYVVLKQFGITYEEQTTKIILSIYQVLLIGKISVSDKKVIRNICWEYSQWIDKNNFIENIKDNSYDMLVYYHKVNKLIIQREWYYLRHKIAIFVKSIIGDFRKWRKKR